VLVAAATLFGVAVGSGGARTAAAPQNTALPTITGVPQEGETLIGDRGQWSGTEPISYALQWRRCDSAGGTCGNIAGATASTYMLKADDVGHTIRLRVTASNADGRQTATSRPTGVVKAALPDAPRNTALPALSGTAKVGETLTGSKGSWEGTEPISYAYQWQRCDNTGGSCASISGATALTYTLTSADAGNTLRFRVIASNTAGRTTALSNASAVVAGATNPPPPPPPPPPPGVNKRPTIVVLAARLLGRKTYVRVRICDDGRKNVTIIERDSKPGVLSFVRRFATLTPPNPCGVYSRTWIPASRFRTSGRYIVTLWARDKTGLMSRPATRTFVR
jgi:hypothetical protein